MTEARGDGGKFFAALRMAYCGEGVGGLWIDVRNDAWRRGMFL